MESKAKTEIPSRSLARYSIRYNSHRQVPETEQRRLDVDTLQENLRQPRCLLNPIVSQIVPHFADYRQVFLDQIAEVYLR